MLIDVRLLWQWLAPLLRRLLVLSVELMLGLLLLWVLIALVLLLPVQLLPWLLQQWRLAQILPCHLHTFGSVEPLVDGTTKCGVPAYATCSAAKHSPI